MFSVQTDNSERNSSLAAFFSARSSLFILFYFFGLFCFVSSVKFRIHNYFYSSVHTTEHQFLQWSEKQKGRGGMFFVTNQCANKIVVKMKGVLCEWCSRWCDLSDRLPYKESERAPHAAPVLSFHTMHSQSNVLDSWPEMYSVVPVTDKNCTV